MPHWSARSVRPLVTSIALFCVHHVSAATLFWDGGAADIATDGDGVSLGGAGTWNTSLLNWDAGVGPHVAWPNDTASIASFGGAAGGVVTVGTAGVPGGTLNLGGLTFGVTGYTIGDVIGNGTLAFGNVQGVLNASALTNTTGTVIINSRLTGTAGLTIAGAGGTAGAGLTRLTGDNTGLTGGVALTAGGLTALSTVSFGNNQIAMSGGSTLFAAGTALSVNNNISLGAGGANFRAYSTSYLQLNGVISENVASSAFTIVDSGLVRLNGINTYTGATNINAGTISFSNIGDATNGGNLGKAGNLVFNGGTLRYTGGNFTTSRTMTQSGTGTFDIVDAGTTVTMSGITSGGAANRFINKAGLGTLVLSGTADNASGRFTISAGTLVLNKTSSTSVHAIGAGGGTDFGLNVTGGTVQLSGTGGDQIYVNTAVQMNGGVFDLNGRAEGFDSLYGNGGIVTNTSATAATLTLGQNNNNGGNGTLNSFNGSFRDGAGTVALVKVGNGTQILNGANTHSGGTTISAGTLQIGNGGSLGTGAIVNNGTLNVTSTTGAAFSAIGGSGALNVNGAGQVILTGASTYAGATTVNAGVLVLNGTVTSPISVNAGGALAGGGATSGTITLAEGSTVVGGSAVVTGNGVIANSTGSGVNILTTGGTLGTNVVDVIKYGTGPAPTVVNFNTGTYRLGAVADDTVNKKITLTYSAEAKTWNPAVAEWDTGLTATWTGGDSIFQTGDTVTIGDIAADTAVAISGTVAPSALTISNSANTLTLNGSGTISGAGGLTKTGNGTLLLATANNYFGQTLITQGTVKLGHSGALGAAGVGNETIVSSGATLDVNGGLAANGLATPEIIKIAGTGVGGNGAIINSSTTVDQNNALAYVTLTANASIGGGSGGTSRMDVRAAATGSPILDLAGFKLTKTGAGLFTVLNGTITGGDIDINGGSFRVEGNTNSTGSGTVTVNSGATLSLYGNSSGAFKKPVVLNTNGTTGSNLTNGGSNAVLASDITLNYAGNLAAGASAQFVSGGVTTTLTGNITGTGSISRFGTGTFVLAGNNTYGGYTLLREGTLRVGSATAIPQTTKVVLYNTNAPLFDINGYNVTVSALNSGSAPDSAGVVFLGSGGGKLTVTGNTAAAGIGNLAGQFAGRFTGFGDIEYNNAGSPQGAWDWLHNASEFAGNVIVTSGRLRFASVNNAPDSGALGNVDTDLVFNGNPVNSLNNGGGTASLQITNGSAGLVPNLAGSRTVTLNTGKEGTFYVWGSTITNVRGVVTGGGNLRKEDSGTLVLANPGNNYTGETRIVNGTLQLGASNVLPDATLVRLGTSNANAPKLDLSGFSETVAGLTSVQPSDAAVLTNGSVTSASSATLTLNTPGNQVFGGAITGNVALTKTGAGIQTLTGANTYSGPTNIDGGTLAVSGSISGSAVAVNDTGVLAGGTLATPGSIINAVAVNSGGTVAPGIGGIGALNVGSLALSSGSTFSLEIGNTTSDVVNVAGVATLTGNVALTIGLSTQPQQSLSFTILNGNSPLLGYAGGGRFVYGLNSLDDGEIFTVADASTLISQDFSISYGGGDGNDVVLTSVPEPTSAVILLSGLASLVGNRRNRRRM